MASDEIKNTAKDMTDRASKSAQQAKEAVSDAASDASGRTQEFAEGATSAASDFLDQARETVGNAADKLPDSASDAMAAGQRAYKRGNAQLSRTVARQPIEALLLAGAIGYLVGWATNRS